MIEKLKYWIFQKGKECSRCCLRCEYFDICRWDVLNGKQTQKAKTIDILAVEMARNTSNNGILVRIYGYIALKREERRKREEL